MAGPEDESAAATDEFDVIARHFAPLAQTPAARGLLDDAALIEPGAEALVVTADACVESVHFLPDDPLISVARKALRVNLSDLAAKAATPWAYLLTLAWPQTRPADQIADFAEGLAWDQKSYGLTLLGGDTVSTPGPLTIAITMFGRLEHGRAPDRRGAAPGEDLWVSGVIGDGWLGLQVLTGHLSRTLYVYRESLRKHYQTPEPRLALAPLLARHASAALDVSDGLIADAQKLAAASGIAIAIRAEAVPHSRAGRRWLESERGAMEALLALVTGGDDYEVLFTAPREARVTIEAQAAALGVPLARIGETREGSGLVFLGVDGAEIPIARAGYSHRLGA